MKTEKTMTVDKNEKSEELIKRKEMENSPFWIITVNNKSFGTLGQYKITEDYNTPEQVESTLKELTWNNIVKIMTIIHEILTSKTN